MGQSRQAVSRRAFVPYLVSRGSAVCLLYAVLLRTGRHVSEQKRTAGFDGSAVHPSAEPIHQLRWLSEAEDCFQGVQKLSDVLLAPGSTITQALESTERAEKAQRPSA